MDCIEQQGSSWNNGGIVTDIYPIHKTVDNSIDAVEFDLEIFM